MVNVTQMKKAAAEAAIAYLPNGGTIGIGTGSTVQYFIEALANYKHKIDAAVASSVITEKTLKKYNIPVVDLNSVNRVPVYFDGADEFDPRLCLIKGGGGALTREKIIATCANQFICIADETKESSYLGHHPIAIEVIPMARSFVAREIIKLGGDPEYRSGFITDNGNVIIDVRGLDISQPIAMEKTLNNVPGIVENGIFACRCADIILVGTATTVKKIEK